MAQVKGEKKNSPVRATGPESSEHEDRYQKEEVKQYLIELGQISKRPKRLGLGLGLW